ncbi:MAG: glycosyltransferase [Nanoarchaeota archaeon]|nr:glycosyltransferase [Nanoarchaeota archaeon]
MKKVSIIIPCRAIDSITEKCVEECLNLDYNDFEIIVLPDEADKETQKKFKDKKIKIIKTGKVKPAFKRNIGMDKAKGEFLAFIDSDAYPKKDWLKNAVKYFEDEKIGLVGGPNLTPPDGNFWEKISGYSLANFWVSGFADIRYKISKNQFTHELPSCNYISREKISPKFDSSFLTAEDSKFCFDIKKKDYKILYAKDVVVCHHRRDTFKKHLKQMWIYARDIAWLTKEDFSFDKIYYSLTAIFSIGFIVLLIGSIFNELIRNVFFILAGFYFLVMFLTSVHENLRTTFAVFLTSVLTHFANGFGWLCGILTKKKLDTFSER